MIRVGSLFSGVGGIDLDLEWAGLGPVAWQVERDCWRRAVLARHWPDVSRFDDVRTVGAGILEPVDLIAGGFPCRGTSSAGKRTGLAHPESGLWYEFARVVRELLPGAVLVENPASGRGRWLAEATAELEAAGYACRDVGVSAREVGSPQFRPRTFLLAKRRPGVSDGLRPGRPRPATVEGTQRVEPAGNGRVGGRRIPDGDYGEPKQPRRIGWPDGKSTAIAGAALDLRGHWRRRLGAAGDDNRDDEPRTAAPKPRLGRVVHELSAGLDGRGRWRWPAARDLPPHSWEAPKLRPAVRGDNRRRRVAALGDSCVPACAFVAALALIDFLAEL